MITKALQRADPQICTQTLSIWGSPESCTGESSASFAIILRNGQFMLLNVDALQVISSLRLLYSSFFPSFHTVRNCLYCHSFWNGRQKVFGGIMRRDSWCSLRRLLGGRWNYSPSAKELLLQKCCQGKREKWKSKHAKLYVQLRSFVSVKSLQQTVIWVLSATTLIFSLKISLGLWPRSTQQSFFILINRKFQPLLPSRSRIDPPQCVCDTSRCCTFPSSTASRTTNTNGVHCG